MLCYSMLMKINSFIQIPPVIHKPLYTCVWLLLLGWCLTSVPVHAQTAAPEDSQEYTLTIRKETVNRAGKDVTGMTINGGIPGPTIRFKEGGKAVIYVKNELDVETSVHWHGLLVPNFYDGVPYLTTPPIKPGQTQKYEFPLKQSGTYWYHWPHPASGAEWRVWLHCD